LKEYIMLRIPSARQLRLAVAAVVLLVGGAVFAGLYGRPSSTSVKALAGPLQVPPDDPSALVQHDAPAPVENPSRADVPTKPLDSGEQEEAEARKKLAFESLTQRLPKGKPITPPKPLDAESRKRWESSDRQLANRQGERAELLKALHERTRKFFVKSPGAGALRFGMVAPEAVLLDKSYVEFSGDPLRQPGEPADFPVSSGEYLRRVKPDEEFHSHHDDGLTGFLHPSGFGYIKDRDHVAGFKPHGFRSPPGFIPFGFHPLGSNFGPIRHWYLSYVQLVGILSQEQPVVYLGDKLPSMEQVRQGKTRALDLFEEVALQSLRDGEDLYIVGKDDTIRMLGAVRATGTCQKCHDAEIGDLLGAFSYTLRPVPNETKREQ
jgi:hypothetical protein